MAPQLVRKTRAVSCGPGGWAGPYDRAEGLAAAAPRGQNREKRAADMLWPMLFRRDGADKPWAMSENTNALAQGPAPPRSGFIILSKLPQSLGFWSLGQHKVRDDVLCACRPQAQQTDFESSGLKPVTL